MVAYTIHARAFHPDGNFGPGGLYFDGDNRGFTTSLSVTSRIRAKWDINFEILSEAAGDIISDPSTAPLLLGRQHQTYEDPRTQPTGGADFRASPYISDALQNGHFDWHFRGINHAFTPWIAFNNLIVPYLDLSGTIAFSISWHEGHRNMQITSTLRGDGFPNSEVFIVDSAGMPLMLNTHHRFGYAAGQLAFDSQHILGGTQIDVGINADGNFVGPIRATRCVDFIPGPLDLLIEENGWFSDTYRTEHSISGWNRVHTGRDPSIDSIIGLDTDNALPIPMRRDRPGGQSWNDWLDPFTAPGPEDLVDWDHP